jgi:hypothetical protein
MNSGLNARIITPTLLAKKSYAGKILATGPIAYWPLNETAGAVAVNYGSLGTDANGAYTGVDLANALGPDGKNYAPWFDGTNDYCDIYTATFIGGFDKTLGSYSVWIKPTDVGVWSDTTLRGILVNQYITASNLIQITKPSGVANDDKIIFTYQQGANIKTVLTPAQNGTDWIHLGLTWTIAGDELKAYLNGVQTGLTQTGLIAPTNPHNIALIGAGTTTPTNVWNGWLAHITIWNRVLSPAEMLKMGTV